MSGPERDRLASLFGALTSAADLASGFHAEKAIRTAVLSTRLAAAHGLTEAEQSDAYYLALVRFLGCTSFAPEAARFGGGDDIALNSVLGFADPDDIGRLVTSVVRGVGVSSLMRLLTHPSAPQEHAAAECDVGDALARQIGMPAGVIDGVQDLFERWDGKGHPHGKEGEEISRLARIVSAADVLELGFARFGAEQAVATARRRSGGRLDPGVASTFCQHAADVLTGLDGHSAWDLFLDAEPGPVRHLTPAAVGVYAEAFARAVDLKSVWTATHSHGVGLLAAAAGEAAGLAKAGIDELRITGWLHDLGRVAVPNKVWDKPGPLNEPEREQVRLHAYQTERLLARSPVLAPVAALAGAVHERGDGAGYPKGTENLDERARLLAACDVFSALREDRPHRPARPLNEATEILLDEAAAGSLDRDAVTCVLEAAGVMVSAPPAVWPDGLTDREVEVLRLVARGGTNKDVARGLGISAKTVQHHVAHIYRKSSVTSRAGAALYAAQHGLTATT